MSMGWSIVHIGIYFVCIYIQDHLSIEINCLNLKYIYFMIDVNQSLYLSIYVICNIIIRCNTIIKSSQDVYMLMMVTYFSFYSLRRPSRISIRQVKMIFHHTRVNMAATTAA